MINMERFKLNSKIELVTEKDERVSGLVYDVFEDRIHVSIPADDRQFKLLRIGDILKAIGYSDKNTFGFECVVTDRIAGDFPIYELAEICNFIKVQRRLDVRVAYTNPMKYTGNRILMDIGNSDRSPQETMEDIRRYLKDGMMLDLSGGGLKLACYEDFSIGRTLLLVFELADETFIVKGRIRHKEFDTAHKRAQYIYGIEFEGIDESVKDRIIYFIFILMRRTQNKIIK